MGGGRTGSDGVKRVMKDVHHCLRVVHQLICSGALNPVILGHEVNNSIPTNAFFNVQPAHLIGRTRDHHRFVQ